MPMEFTKSLGYFLFGIIKRFWLLLPTLLSDPFDIAERWFNMQYVAPPYMFWLLLSLGCLAAAIMTYHELRCQNLQLSKEATKHKQEYKRIPKNKLRANEHIVIQQLNRQMQEIHGHSDIWGLQNDILNGIDTNELLERNCMKCGIQRNQKGKML